MNPYFESAMEGTSRFYGRNQRILNLLTSLTTKLNGLNWKNVNASQLKEKFFVLFRLTKAYAKGYYRGVSWKTITLILGTILYFINPFDLIPDIIPGIGLSDDFSLLVGVYSSLQLEIQKFLDWEKDQAS